MDDKKEPTGDDEVGYRRPPKAHRFPKGTSGNPEGRPKKSQRERIDVAGVLNEPIEVKSAGARQKMASFEVGVRQLVKRGLANNKLDAIIAFLELCERYGVIKPAPVDHGGGVIHAPKGVDFYEWLEANTVLVPRSSGNDEDDALN